MFRKWLSCCAQDDKVDVTVVQSLLEQVQQLARQLDTVSFEETSPEVADRLWSEIIRKLAICHTIAGPPQSGVSESSMLFWRVNAELEPDLMQLINITEGMVLGDIDLIAALTQHARWKPLVGVTGEMFPYYELLPPEVRKIILNKVNSPLDELSIILAIPGDSRLLDKDLRIICDQVSQQSDELLKSCVFRKRRGYFNPYHNPYPGGLTGDEFFMELMDAEWFQTRGLAEPKYTTSIGPIALCVHLDHPTNKLDQDLAKFRDFKQKGYPVWFCVIICSLEHIYKTHGIQNQKSYHYELSKAKMLELCDYICEFLSLMPDLRRLEFCSLTEITWPERMLDGKEFFRKSPNEKRALNRLLLPELPHLRYLKMYDLFKWPSGFQQIILEKYAPQLKFLEVPPVSLESWNSKQFGKVHASNLTGLKWHFNISSMSQLSTSPLRFELLRGSPLKLIRLAINAHPDVNGKVKMELSSLMGSLNCFGETLEKLQIQLGSNLLQQNGDWRWITSLNFPRLKVFEVEGFPGGWNFLLQLPRLTSLVISNWPGLPQDVYFPLGSILELTWDFKEMCGSNVWKLFPDLENIFLENWHLNRELHPCPTKDDFSYLITRDKAKKVRLATARLNTVTPDRFEKL